MRQLPDVQKKKDGFPHMYIEKVGVENIKVQLPINTWNENVQYVFANMKSYCSLIDDVKGINMSRIGQTIFRVIEEEKEGGFKDLEKFAYELWNVHGNETELVYVSAEFDYLLDQKTPITKLYSPKVVKVGMATEYNGTEMHNYLTVKSTEMSLCPCSKEMSLIKNILDDDECMELNRLSNGVREKVLMSGYGAHNQKSEITITIEISNIMNFTIEKLASIIAACASAPTYSTLKRPDEKWVTEVSYLGGYWNEGTFIEVGGGPKFVEDIVRTIGVEMNRYLDNDIKDYLIYIKNYESIHSENIVASAIMSAGRYLKKML